MDHGLLAGQQLSDTYRVVRPLAHGGMGAVYEAVHLRLGGKRYAIKVLASRYASNPEAVARFRREALVTSGLRNEHIVEVHDFNIDAGLAYLVMELLDGEDLASRLKRARCLALDAVARILAQLVVALDAAHRARIVHRDLKPQNIFLCARDGRDDYVKVLDFGISKLLDSSTMLTGEHTLLGTPYYMAPEQAQGSSQHLDGRADVFALGAILWELLTGEVAFAAPTISGALYKVCMVDPPDVHTVRPDVPPAVSMVLRRALAKDPAGRTPDVVTLGREFAAALHGVAPDGVPPTAPGSVKMRAEVSGPATVASFAGAPGPRLTALEGGAGSRGASGIPHHAAVPSPAANQMSPTASAAPVWMPGRPVADESAYPDASAVSRIATGSVYVPAPRSRRRGILALAITCVAVAMVVTAIVVGVRGSSRGSREVAVAVPPPQPRPAPAPQLPDEVAIVFAVEPKGTEVALRVDGTLVTDGRLRRTRSRTPLVVTAEAAGYVPFRAEPVPDRDQLVTVSLQPAPPVAAKVVPPRRAPAPVRATRAEPPRRSPSGSTSGSSGSSVRAPDAAAPTREPPAPTARVATPTPDASRSPERAASVPPDAGAPKAPDAVPAARPPATAPAPPATTPPKPKSGTIFDAH